MRVLLCTGIEALDKALSEELSSRGIEVAGECYERSSITRLLARTKADVAVVSPSLPGSGDFLDILLELRLRDARVVLLPGPRTRERAAELVSEAVFLGIYDVVFDPVLPSSVAERILHPASLADVREFLDEKEGRTRRAKLRAALLPRRDGSSSAPAVNTEPDTTAKVEMEAEIPAGSEENTSSGYAPGLVAACWSPVSAGSTFVSVNLASYMASVRRMRTALVDLTGSGAVATWLNLAGEERAVSPPAVPGLRVLECGAAGLCGVLPSLQECDLVVVDSGRSPPAGVSCVRVTVVDTDYHRCVTAAKILRGSPGGVVVVTRHRTVHGVPYAPEEVLGVPAVRIPDLPEEVLKSQLAGIPAVFSSYAVEAAFSVLADRVLTFTERG